MKPLALPKEPSAVDWARLAAFLDGEGHLRVHEQQISRHRNPRGDWMPILHLYVSVHNTDVRLINWLQATFGGAASMNRSFVIGKPWKQCFQWTATSRHAAMLLSACLPYFIIKREQAEIALAFQETIGKQGKRVSEEVKRKRYALKSKLQSLTARGVEAVN